MGPLKVKIHLFLDQKGSTIIQLTILGGGIYLGVDHMYLGSQLGDYFHYQLEAFSNNGVHPSGNPFLFGDCKPSLLERIVVPTPAIKKFSLTPNQMKAVNAEIIDFLKNDKGV